MSLPERRQNPSELFPQPDRSHDWGDPAHIANCPECAGIQKLQEALTMLYDGSGTGLGRESSGNGQAGKDCIPEDDIYALAAGLAAPEAEALLAGHLSACSRCSHILKQALEDLGAIEAAPPPPTPQLESATEAWQRNLAERMVRERSLAEFPAKGAPPRKPRGKPQTKPQTKPWFWLASAATAATLFATATAGYFYWSSHDIDRLLAAAYNAQRRTELRIPGAEPVPLFSPKLGSSRALEPTALLQAKLEAQQHLEQAPNDAYWLQVRGRIALVEHEGDAARHDFELASAHNEKLPGLKLDLASAHFEIAETNDDPVEYAHAADLDGQAIDQLLQSGPKDLLAIAYFNRALAWEKQSVYFEALKDYQAALALESRPAWRRDLQSRIDRLSALQKRPQAGLPSPAGFLRDAGANPAEAGQNYEIYLDAATRSWLPQRESDPATATALRKLAQLGQAHRDRWLQDLLAFPNTPKSQEAGKHLAAAANANANGEASQALREAETAANLYRQANNQPGYLRAQAEAVYTLQRLGRSQDCLERSAPLQRGSALNNYAWLRGYLILEIAACRASQGDIPADLSLSKAAMSLAQDARLDLMGLRAQGFQADALAYLGEIKGSWRLAGQGLAQCPNRRGSEMRAYQFLAGIYFAAQNENLLWEAAGIADAAAQASLSLQNRQTQAYAQEDLGVAETAVHHDRSAAQAFAAAAERLSGLGNGAAKALYRADWTADRAALLAQSGHLPAALQAMQGVAAPATASGVRLLRQAYFCEYAQLLLDAGKPKDAEQLALRAVYEAEQSLPTLHNGIEKLTWERDYSRSYKLLVQSLAAQGDAPGSLRAWEWFRSAPYRPAQIAATLPSGVLSLPPNLPLPRPPAGELLLVFARLNTGYAAWSVSAGLVPSVPLVPFVRLVPLPLAPNRLTSLAESMSTLVEDPTSSQAAIAVFGSAIFKATMQPFADQIAAAKTLRIDLDPSLQSLPLPAIPDGGNAYLGTSHDLLILAPWWSRNPLPTHENTAYRSAVVVAGSPVIAPGDAASRIPEEDEESAEVARKFPQANLIRGPGISAGKVAELLPGADLFHFNGHAIQRDGEPGLVLGSSDDLLKAASLSNRNLHRCKLAVLAGCTTAGRAGYQAEDPRSLVNALLLAGAGNVVATQWDVDAKASKNLMLHFYDALASGSPPAHSLRSGQLAMSSNAATAHPYFWAAYQAYSR